MDDLIAARPVTGAPRHCEPNPMSHPLRIAFAGIGLMGLPMCRRLLAALLTALPMFAWAAWPDCSGAASAVMGA